MKTFLTAVGLFCASLPIFSSTHHSFTEKNKPKEWVLVWEDDFNGPDLFDTKYWSKIPRGGSDWNNTMSFADQCFSKAENGINLWGIVNDSIDPQDHSPYLTGGIFTKGKKSFTEGRVSVRARLEAATGAWPAIWMLPENAPWPSGGEIDIMERLNFDSFVYQTVHSNYTLKDEANKQNPPQSGTGEISPSDFNVYSVEISADSLVFFVNDIKTFTYPRVQNLPEQYPFLDQPMYLLIDMQLGGNWVGEVDPNQLPVAMEVDWVRYYKSK